VEIFMRLNKNVKTSVRRSLLVQSLIPLETPSDAELITLVRLRWVIQTFTALTLHRMVEISADPTAKHTAICRLQSVPLRLAILEWVLLS